MSLPRHAQRFLDHLGHERGLARHSVAAYRRDLELYGVYLEERGRTDPAQLDSGDLLEFLAWLGERRSSRGTPYAASTLARAFSAVRGLHRFLARQGLAEHDPTGALEGPRSRRELPQPLTPQQVQALLGSPVGDGPAALRDRAMLELLYAAGLRISELVALDVADLDLDRGVVRCRSGEARRMLPLSPTALRSGEAWLRRGRPVWSPSTTALLCNRRGGRLTRQGGWKIIKQHAEAVGLGTAVSPHTLRHSFAAHLLGGGADVRVVQELLGHASVRTTRVYTRVGTTRLQSSHDQTHLRVRSAAEESQERDRDQTRGQVVRRSNTR